MARRAGELFTAVLLTALLSSSTSADKRVSIYSTAANYCLAVAERDGQDYASLLEILEPLGTVSAKTDGPRWKLRYNNVDSEFTPGKTHARIHERDLELSTPFLLENGRGLVPLSSLSALLPRFLGGPVMFHETSRRLFIGSVATHFTAQMKSTTPPGLVMNFTSPVNPAIATEPGKLHMLFTHEPLVPPGSQTLTFDSKMIPSATYQEDNGSAEIVIAGNAPLFASFSNGGRTITVVAAAQAVATVPTVVPTAQPNVPPATPPPQPGSPSASTLPSRSGRYFAVVDASHGGDERGATLSDQLAEKDVTLAFAHSLRQTLENQGLRTLVLRDGDAALTLDQRAVLTNQIHPAIYICVHASSQGTGVRLYTALLPAGAENRGPFLDWNTAQASFLAMSQSAAASLAAELQKNQVPVRTLAAALRPLNNTTSAAVALEVAPQTGDLSELTSPTYQQLVASSVAAGVLAVRDKLEGGR